MAKNPSKKSKPVNREDPMNGAMKFFLAGLVAELYLLIIRRFYVNGTAVQMITWYDYLFYFSIAGLVILAAGAVLSAVWRKEQKKRHIGWYIAGAGAFLALASFLIWKLNTPALTFLSVLVPVVMLLGILWNLYDRECAYALTILGLSLVALWGCRRELSNLYLGTYVKVFVVVSSTARASAAPTSSASDTMVVPRVLSISGNGKAAPRVVLALTRPRICLLCHSMTSMSTRILSRTQVINI